MKGIKKIYSKIYKFIIGSKTVNRFEYYFIHFMTSIWFLFVFLYLVGTLLYILGINFGFYVSSLFEFAMIFVVPVGTTLLLKLLIYIHPKY